MGFAIAKLDHVQLAMPEGREDLARSFYVGVLGLRELAKPPVLARRGGCWFAGDGFEVHVGVEADFRPAKKAHPAFVVEDYEDLLVALQRSSIEVRPDSDIEGVTRCHIDDPFGNRIELIAAR